MCYARCLCFTLSIRAKIGIALTRLVLDSLFAGAATYTSPDEPQPTLDAACAAVDWTNPHADYLVGMGDLIAADMAVVGPGVTPADLLATEGLRAVTYAMCADTAIVGAGGVATSRLTDRGGRAAVLDAGLYDQQLP